MARNSVLRDVKIGKIQFIQGPQRSCGTERTMAHLYRIPLDCHKFR